MRTRIAYPPARLRPTTLAPGLRTLAATLGLWLRRARTRRRLAEIDARALDDVGLTERQRHRECARWFWT